jgi:hypothetical protein
LDAYARLCAWLDVFGRRVGAAKDRGDVRYFFDHDDFREVDPDKPTGRPEGFFLRNSLVCVITVLVYVLAYAAADGVNRQKPERAPRHAAAGNRSSARVRLTSPVLVQPAYPEHALPENSTIWLHADLPRVAPFEITAPFGENCMVKLVDATTARPVLTVFIRAGSTATIDAPLGGYVLKYALGEKWYGPTYLFGPTTGYGKANEILYFYDEGSRYVGNVIRLQKAAGGNLRTESIPASEF